jgi:Beta propeller domain
VLALLKTSDILPTVQIDGGRAESLVADTDCYVQTKNASLTLQVTTITAIDLNSPTLQRNSRCFVGGNEAIYVSPSNVYVATTRYTYDKDKANPSIWIYPVNFTTDFHKFAIDGLNVRYKASGEAKGQLGWEQDKKSYRMSEHNDDLRVITFTGSTGWWGSPEGNASPATLTVLREQADAAATKLNAIATLPNSNRPQPLGVPGEQIYAVRFIGDRGYVVTFRRTDPLYVLDLSDPADPKTVGELKAPGFSDYLFPIGRDLVLGVGKDATENGVVQGVKVGLIDVSDVKNPKEIATRTIGKAWSSSALDYSSHGINLFTQGDVTRIALPILVRDDGYWARYQGLHRFEVDARSKTLADKPYVLGTTFPANTYWYSDPTLQNFNIATERSVQIGAQVYYLTGGEIKSSNWDDASGNPL